VVEHEVGPGFVPLGGLGLFLRIQSRADGAEDETGHRPVHQFHALGVLLLSCWCWRGRGGEGGPAGNQAMTHDGEAMIQHEQAMHYLDEDEGLKVLMMMMMLLLDDDNARELLPIEAIVVAEGKGRCPKDVVDLKKKKMFRILCLLLTMLLLL